MKQLLQRIKESKYNPYWLRHAVISIAISIGFIAYGNNKLSVCALGVLFYLGREIAQYEEKKTFDYKGLLAPLIASVILYHFI